ncbi:MAG: hypothetical protein WC205_07140 [Opitutaceae bacterium]|jgi:hypothetical protein
MNRYLVSLILLLPCGLLHAQTSPAPTAPAARTFRIFSIVGSFIDYKYELKRGAEPIRLSIGPLPTRAYVAPAGADLIIYREVPPPPDSPPGTKPTRSIIARVELPAAQPRSLVIVAPLADGTFATRVLDDDPAQHPAGTLRLVNLSTFPAAVALDRSTHPVDSGASSVVAYGAGGKLVQLAVQKQGAWTVSYSEEHMSRPELHAYGFIFNYAPAPDLQPDPQAAPAIFRLFMDRLPAPRPDKTG